MTLPFNVRVYGLLIHNSRLLVSEERHVGIEIRKFPGGGLQFGEGTIQCLKREFLEEVNLDIEINEHFYTVDFFQASQFNPKQQVISVYYSVKPIDAFFEDPTLSNINEHRLRWIPLTELSADTFSLPIDQHVVKLIKKSYIA